MADFTISSNMNLPIPTVGAAAGPLYAEYVDGCLTLIDQHNHAPGNGVQITPTGLNLNADLPFNTNNATLLRTTRFSPQVSLITSAAPDQGCLYVAAVSSAKELFYNDYAGNQVQITSGGIVNATGSTISNGTVTAQINGSNELIVAYNSTHYPANISGADLIMGSASNGSNLYTMQPPTLGSSQTVTMPPYPSVTSFLQMDTSGNITGAIPTAGGLTTSNLSSTAGILGTQIAALTITASSNNIANNAITGPQVAANSLNGTKLVSNISLQGNPSVSGIGQIATGPSTGPNASSAPKIQYARINSSGTLLQGSGITSGGWSSNVLTITFDSYQSPTLPIIVATGTTQAASYTVSNITGSSAQITAFPGDPDTVNIIIVGIGQ